MADKLQSWFKQLPYTLKRELAGRLQEIAGELADDIKSAAPVKSGALRDSITVRRGRGALTFNVEAGGAATTKTIQRTAGYERDVAIDSGDTEGIARGGGGHVTYDYAMAVEFGTHKMPAEPFFYSTFRVREPAVREQIEQAVNDVLGKA